MSVLPVFFSSVELTDSSPKTSTSSAFLATTLYYLVILAALLAGNALSVLGGVDLVEHAYHMIHNINPILYRCAARVKSILQHFKLIKVNTNGNSKKPSVYNVNTHNDEESIPTIAISASTPTIKRPTIIVTSSNDSTDATNVHETELD